jgi:hypothetical protein
VLNRTFQGLKGFLYLLETSFFSHFLLFLFLFFNKYPKLNTKQTIMKSTLKFTAFTMIVALLTLFVREVGAQTTSSTYVYTLVFPEYEMSEIKPLVALTQPLFDTNIEIQNDDYKRFIYRSENVVSEEEVRKALEGTKYQLVSLEVKK